MASTQLAPDETVEFFTTCGHLDASGDNWLVPVHGWTYKPQREGLALKVARAVFRRALRLKAKHQEAESFQTRATRFLVDNLPGKEIVVRIGGQEHRLPVTGPNGHSRQVLRLPAGDIGGATRLTVRAALPAYDAREFAGEAHLLPRQGLSVISDVDDTIKISDVRDRQQLMKNTFLRPFEPAAGMAALYGRLAAAGASFHYVTSAPWQLYHPLEDFRLRQGFPAGSWHMKKFRLKDRSFFDLFASAMKSKPKHVEPLLAALPCRRFLLIGDSGEQDPEVYAELARRFPVQVRAVWIRNVTAEGRENKRLRKVFRELPAELWQVFDSPEQLDLSRIVAG